MTFPLVPRDPTIGIFTVAIGRISDEKQNIENIDASYRYVSERLAQAVQQEVSVTYLGEQSSGYITDRATMMQLEDLIEQDRVDLIVAEDLSRIYRNPRLQYSFVQDAFDRRIHVICFADGLDTRKDDWEVVLGATALRHGLMIPDTVRRVRRTATHAFHSGGMVQKVRFGYRKLTREEAQSGQFGPVGLRLMKLAEYTPIFKELRLRVMDDGSYNSVARWLKEQDTPAGVYVGELGWTGRLVRDLLADPILSGTRQFRRTLFQRVFKTGRHKRHPNDSPEVERYESLAHYTEDEHAELLEVMLARAGTYQRKKGRESPRYGRPRTDTTFPFQHLRCLCGEMMYSVGKWLKCHDTLPDSPRSCWNHVQVPVEILRDKFTVWLLGVLDQYPGIRDLVAASACEAIGQFNESASRKGRADTQLLHDLENQAKRLAKAIAKLPDSEALQGELHTVEKKISAIKRRESRAADGNVLAAVQSPQDVLDNLPTVLRTMAGSSNEFTKLMRKLLPEFYIQPVQALDRPQVHPRLKLKFSTAVFCKSDEEPIEISASMDVFEPAAYITNVHRNMQLSREAKERSPRLNLDRIAEAIGVHHMELKRSRAYWGLMQARQTEDPFIELTSPPQNASRWRLKAKAG